MLFPRHQIALESHLIASRQMIRQHVTGDFCTLYEAHPMTSEDSDKLVRITYNALRSEFGFMGDLPCEIANTVANVYFRYFQQANR
jgi:hypothetical protein